MMLTAQQTCRVFEGPDVQNELMGTGAVLALVQHRVGALQPLGHVVGVQNSTH